MSFIQKKILYLVLIRKSWHLQALAAAWADLAQLVVCLVTAVWMVLMEPVAVIAELVAAQAAAGRSGFPQALVC